MHTRYDATVIHDVQQNQPIEPAKGLNPDEIAIEDDDFEDGSGTKNKAVEATELVAPKTSVPRNPDEIMLEDEEEDVVVPPPPPPPPSVTKFLALDKCLPRRQFLEVFFFLPSPTRYSNRLNR